MEGKVDVAWEVSGHHRVAAGPLSWNDGEIDILGMAVIAEDPVEVQSSTSTTAIADCQALQDVQEKIVIVSEAETQSIQHDAT